MSQFLNPVLHSFSFLFAAVRVGLSLVVKVVSLDFADNSVQLSPTLLISSAYRR